MTKKMTFHSIKCNERRDFFICNLNKNFQKIFSYVYIQKTND